jgi:hypothetical protein
MMVPTDGPNTLNLLSTWTTVLAMLTPYDVRPLRRGLVFLLMLVGSL